MDEEEDMLKIRHSYGCIDERDFPKLKSYKKLKIDINVFGETMTRNMVKVPLKDHKTGKFKDYYVDTITGTMYDPNTGHCTSNYIYIEQVTNC